MNYTAPSEFRTLKQFLQEGEDDVFAGVKTVLQDIRNAWSGGSRQKVENQRRSAVKKLLPPQKAMLTRNINAFIAQTLLDLRATPNYGIVTNALTDIKEVTAAVNVFLDLANSKMDPASASQSKIADLARSFLHSAVLDKVIDEDKSTELFQHVISPTDFQLGHQNAAIFTQNHDFFKQVFFLDAELGIQPSAGGELLHKKLGGTNGEGKEGKLAAVIGVINGLQKFRFICLTMIDMIKAEGIKRGPPKPPKDPTDDRHPAAKVTKPGGASMQPKVDANHAEKAAKPNTPAPPDSTVDNTPDIVAGLKGLGYEQGVAKRLASRLPKGLSTEDAIKQVLRGGK